MGQLEAKEASPLRFKDRLCFLREQEILDVAERKLKKLGYSGFTLDEVANEVGISKPTLYFHFKSKEEMVASVGARVINSGIAFLESLSSEQSALSRLEAIIGFIVETRFGASGILFGAETPTSALSEQQSLRSAVGVMRNRLTEIVSELQKEGLANPEIPPVLLAAALLSLARDYRYEEMVATGITTPAELCTNWLRIMAPYSSINEE